MNCPSGQEHPAVPIDAALHRALPLRGNSAAHHQSTQALLPTPFPSALLRRKMLLLRKSICTGAIHLPLCFSMSHGFLARSRASIRSAAENCYRRNSLPPLNNLNQAETRSAASRPKKVHDFRRGLFLCFHYTIDEPLSHRRGFNQQENQARFCKNVFSAMWITKSRSSESAFAKSI